jgi:hypothetical protein
VKLTKVELVTPAKFAVTSTFPVCILEMYETALPLLSVVVGVGFMVTKFWFAVKFTVAPVIG